MKAWLILYTVVLSLAGIFAQSNGERQELVKQLLAEARRLRLKIDSSQIRTTVLEDGGIIASVPLFDRNELKIDTDRVKSGNMFVSLHCMRTKSMNGCYRVQANGFIEGSEKLDLSFVDRDGKAVTDGKPELIEHQKINAIIIIIGPVDVYINGKYLGRFDLVIIW